MIIIKFSQAVDLICGLCHYKKETAVGGTHSLFLSDPNTFVSPSLKPNLLSLSLAPPLKL